MIQIITGVTLAMHYNPNVLEAFNSVEHIMRDVNNGWLIRYLHSNTASAFFFLVYLHIGRGLYYGSYKAPRTLVWTIGTIIFILMMAKQKVAKLIRVKLKRIVFSQLNTVKLDNNSNAGLKLLPFNRTRTRAILRVGPHNGDILSILICGMLGDWWADEIKGQILPSVRFNLEQSVKNSAYIHSVNILLFEWGYCSELRPKLVKKSEGTFDKRLDTSVTRFNYRLTLFTFTSFHWIYKGFYHNIDGVTVKKVPQWIGEYITPLALAHLVMQIGSLENEGLILCTKLDNIEDLYLVKTSLKKRYSLDSTIISHSSVSKKAEIKEILCIRAESMPVLRSIIHPYIHSSFLYLLQTNTLNSRDTLLLSNENVIPVATYANADVQKELAVRENRGKSGVYRWINKKTGKSYIGSSIDLSRRFNQYYNYNHISDLKHNMLIYKALLKSGYSNFQLQILEYCDKYNLLEREQYYIDLLKPEYNILLNAASSLGFKHTEKTILKMKAPKSEESLVKIRNHLANLNASPFSPEVRARISAGMANFNILSKGKKVVFTHIETHETLSFISFRDASLKMNISRNTINKYILSQEVYGKYKISLI